MKKYLYLFVGLIFLCSCNKKATLYRQDIMLSRWEYMIPEQYSDSFSKMYDNEFTVTGQLSSEAKKRGLEDEELSIWYLCGDIVVYDEYENIVMKLHIPKDWEKGISYVGFYVTN